MPATFYGSALDDSVSIRGSCIGAPTAGRGRGEKESFSKADLDTYVGPAVVSRIQSNPDYASYGGSENGGGELERTPHNFVHRWVGGPKQSNMVQFFSPLDPIFWMHHCNIDRLYSDWLQRPGHTAPVKVPDWANKSFNDFFDAQGKPAGGQWTCGATVDSRVLGYEYDSRLQLPASLSAQATRQPALSLRAVTTLTAERAAIAGGVASYSVAAVTRAEDKQFIPHAPRHVAHRRGYASPHPALQPRARSRSRPADSVAW